MLLERHQLTAGTTWHAAGLMVTYGSTSETSTEIRKYTRDLYGRLEAETGQATGFMPIGFIEVASDKDRLEEFRRVAAFNRYCGIDVQEISPRQVQELFPLAKVDDIEAGFYVKEDGRVNPVDVTMALGKGARMRGVKILEGVPATGVIAEERACHRGQHAIRRHPDRLRRELRRPVGTRVGRNVGRRDFEPGSRALLPDHRGDQGPAAEHAGARGSIRVRLLPRRKAAA